MFMLVKLKRGKRFWKNGNSAKKDQNCDKKMKIVIILPSHMMRKKNKNCDKKVKNDEKAGWNWKK